MKINIKHRTDQWNADDFVAGPRTFTIAEVKKGKAEQQYDIELVEGEGKAWRPPVQVLMLLVAAWGDDSVAWRGRRVRLYRDETIRFGPDAVGGIRVSHMSDLPNGEPFKTKVTATRGKRIQVGAEPLPDAAPSSPAVSEETLAVLIDTFARKGIAEEHQLPGVNHITGGSATALEVITEEEARRVLAALEQRPDVDGSDE